MDNVAPPFGSSPINSEGPAWNAGSVRSKNQYEIAADEWAAARTRYMDALEAHGRAQREVEESRVAEKAAWAQMEKVSERTENPPPIPYMSPGVRVR